MNKINIFHTKLKFKDVIRSPGISDIPKALILVLCQRAQIFSLFPFGIAFFTAFSTPQKAYIYVGALAIGALISGGAALKYILASIIVWILKTIIPNSSQKKLLIPLLSSVSLFVCGIYWVFLSATPFGAFLLLTAEALISFFACKVFDNLDALFKRRKENMAINFEHSFSLLCAIAIVIIGLDGVYLPFGISVRTLFSIYIVLCITMYSSQATSAMFAFFCGFLSCIASSDSLMAASVFVIGTFFAGLLKLFGQVGAAIGFLTGITVCVLYIGNTAYMPLSLIDIFIATGIFAFIPIRFHQRLGIFLANTFKSNDARRDFRIKEYITEELNSVSNTFREFSRQFTGTFQKALIPDSDVPSRLFDETAERICNSCSRRNDCWHKNFNDTYKYMFEIYNIIGKNGHCDLHDAPIIFTQRCIQPELFLNEFNHVYEMTRQSELELGIKTGERRMFSNQYVEISKIISRLSEEIEGNFFFDEAKERLILSECSKEAVYIKDLNVIKNAQGYYEVFFAPGNESQTEEICNIVSQILETKMKYAFCKNKSIVKLVTANSYEVRVAFFQKERDDEPVSGDTVVHFATDKSKYYIILCDGMGSGYDASRESRMTAELLGGFLKAGFSKSVALNLINSTLALKMDREGFSTIDLCEIDLRSGVCEFVKIGGAQSYIKSGDKIDIISARSLPAGILEEINPDNIEVTLADNDLIVMVSDGVCEAGYGMMRGEWIKRMMRLEGLCEAELSKSIVNSARKKIYPRTADDMTAAVISVHKIEENKKENMAI